MRHSIAFLGRGVYKISGIVCEEFDCISIEADRLEKLGLVPDARYVEGVDSGLWLSIKRKI